MSFPKYKRIIYLNSGAIGEYLMTLHFFDSIRRACVVAGIAPPDFVVVVNKSDEMLRGITVSSDVTVMKSLVRNLGQNDAIILQQTFGRHSLKWKIACLIARIQGASVFGFRDASSTERFLFPETLHFDTASNFPEQMIRLARSLGYNALTSVPVLDGFTDKAFVKPKDDGVRIFVNPCAASLRRTPTANYWKRVLTEIESRIPNVTCLIGGSPGDIALCNEVHAGLGRRDVVAGTMSLADVALTIASCDVYLGPDTGITHLAAFVGVPSVVVGTNSTPCWWNTYSKKATWLTSSEQCMCDGKKGTKCFQTVEGVERYRCMVNIPIMLVVDAVVSKIKRV